MGFHPLSTATSEEKKHNLFSFLLGRPKSVHRRYFIHTLLSTLLYTLVPVLLLGMIISTIMVRNLRSTAAGNNYNILSQFQSGTENIINEVNYINIQISVNSTVYKLLEKTMTFNNYSSYVTKLTPTVNSYLIPLIATKDYIDSMYIYLDNPYGRYVSVPNGLCLLSQSNDTTWLNGYVNRRSQASPLWCIPRQYRKYSFLPSDTSVISVYQKFYNGQGVSIINLSSTYFEEKLRGLSLSPEQIILVVNDADQILFSNRPADIDNYTLLHAIPSTATENISSYTIGKERYYMVQFFSPLGNLRYISLTPYKSLYTSVYHFYYYIFLLIILISALCLLISYIVSRQFYQNISGIIGLFSAAEKGENFPDVKKPKDLYGLLMQNITRTFVQQNALKMQLRENEYQNKLLELQSLHAQISPHFLFNTLKSIFWMSFQLTASNNKVCEMIENMTNILDYSLTEHSSLVPLQQEIRNTCNYIDIQRIRHNYQFSVTWNYPEELMQYSTLKLMLQPFIENCIIHAFTWEEENNVIKIIIRKKNGNISIRVIDNGLGMSTETQKKIRNRLNSTHDEGHIGIYNTNRRLKLTYGALYGVTLKSMQGIGTIFTIMFPALYEHSDE